MILQKEGDEHAKRLRARTSVHAAKVLAIPNQCCATISFYITGLENQPASITETLFIEWLEETKFEHLIKKLSGLLFIEGQKN